MRKILIATAAFALLGASSAFAQPQGQGNGDEHRRHEEQNNQGGRGGQPAPQGQQRQGPQGPQGPQYRAQQYQAQPYRGQGGQAYQGQYPNQGRQQFQGRPQFQGQPQPGQQGYAERRYNGQQGQWQGGQWRGQEDRADHRDWGRFERNTMAVRRFSFGVYARPQGWYYRRWRYGEFLPWLFWTQNYWISDYSYFGLPYPPPGCVWIRYGDDALLIDRYTGEIVEVIYGLFY
jgi:Ni/Co efflux regulator RcnB